MTVKEPDGRSTGQASSESDARTCADHRRRCTVCTYLRAEWQASNGYDLSIAWLFATMLTVPVAGEASLLLLALGSLPAMAQALLRWPRAAIPWREVGLMAAAVGSITVVKALSALWSVSPHASLKDTGTHLHFVFWLPLTLLFLRAHRPVDAMVLGARAALLGLIVWTLWFWWRYGIQLNWADRLEAGAQNAGVLGQLATMLVLWMGWLWRREPSVPNLLWMLAGVGPVVASGGRVHIVVMALGLISIAALAWRSKPARVWRLRVLLGGGPLLALLTSALAPRMEQAWDEALSYSTAPQEAVATSVGNRIGLYDAAWRAFPDSPWLGFGAGTSKVVVPRYASVDAPFAATSHYHQQAIQVLLETGVLGFALCLLAVLYVSAWFRNRGEAADERIWPFYGALLYTTASVGMFTGSLQQGLIHVFMVAVLAVLAAQSLKPAAPITPAL